MATKNEEFFHDKWLGHVQTESDGLVVAKPVLLAAGCAQHQPPEVQEKLRELCPLRAGAEGAPRRIADLMPFLQQLLDFDSELFESAAQIPDEVSLYALEGPQIIRPTFGLLHQGEFKPREGAGSPSSNAAAKYVALIWDVTDLEGKTNNDALGLVLDKPETVTGDWSYPAAAKFDRLLRHCQVPVGILTNREVIRLVYAPHGESSGHITFRVDDMATVGGRPILDAMIMLLCANQWFGVSDENSLPSLLRRSREYQGNVTEDLAEQVFGGLEALLKGFQAAAERDKSGLLKVALERDEDYLYRGLLTVMLRLVFILYAEDRSLLPVEQPLYAKRMSLLGLFERLQRDNGNFPDSMSNRFGAWGHIISLCRAIYLGVDHGDFHIPPRQGDLFDPHIYSFLEGWTGESAPIVTQNERSNVRVPTVDDGTIFILLSSLLIFQGQRLNYRTLDVEQIGSVYEALMGYHVTRCESAAVAIKLRNKKGSPKFWLAPDAVLARPATQRIKWLQDECGFDKPVATKIKKILSDFKNDRSGGYNAAIEALLAFAAGKQKSSFEQRANIGEFVLQPGAERRRSGSHYTPRSLTEPIVRKTLEPLIRCLGEAPTVSQLFELKLCDPAMGSGAFLVECCRQLADEVVAAWARAHEIEVIAATCPDGDVIAHARRLVAQRCLYGVDKNFMAVQLAKLSLWLFTLARDLPFTFLDHSLRVGDSLVGLNFEQIKAFHWKPSKQIGFLEVELKKALDEVVTIRQDIHRLAIDTTPEGQKLKSQRLFDAADAIDKIKNVADVCIGAFFIKDKEKARIAERQIREDQIRAFLAGDEEASKSVEKWGREIRERHAPFHWWLEFPEIFFEERLDPLGHGEANEVASMDAFIGNPPFLGQSQLTKTMGGPAYAEWLKIQNSGASGQVDLSAYFFRRAFSLLGAHGTIGLLATNTISQGDTRNCSLKPLLKAGGQIYEAKRSFLWPGDAAITVALVHFAFGRAISVDARIILDGRDVNTINSRLRPKPERPDAVPLAENKSCAFIGTSLGGNGFVLSQEEYDSLIHEPRNYEKLYPYLGGQEVNTSPTQSHDRYVINFGSSPLEDAEKWPSLLKIIREKVKPEREKGKDHGPGKHGKKYWWQHTLRADPLYAAIKLLDRCLVTARVSTHLMFSFQPVGRIFSEQLYVFPFNTFTSFSVLQSRIHVSWTWLHSSTMKDDLRYSAGDCFFVFPFPSGDPHKSIPAVEYVGAKLYAAREKIMIYSNQGLTKIYNLLEDPDCEDDLILNLRLLHEAVDRAVLDAYGWSDIVVPPYCPMNADERSLLETFENEVIDRLYVLNVERASGEKLQKLSIGVKKTALKKSESKRFQANTNPVLSLFEINDDDRVTDVTNNLPNK
jgi:hypothetical protein